MPSFAIDVLLRLDEAARREVSALCRLCDADFVPPLSRRRSTHQRDLFEDGGSLDAYLGELLDQPAVLARDRESGRLVGFLSWKPGFTAEPPLVNMRCAYVTTVIVAPDMRGNHIADALYGAFEGACDEPRAICRTWSGNCAYLAVLERRGWQTFVIYTGARGADCDTVYLSKKLGVEHDLTFVTPPFQSGEWDCGWAAVEGAVRLVCPRERRYRADVRLIQALMADDEPEAAMRALAEALSAVNPWIRCAIVTGNDAAPRDGSVLVRHLRAGGVAVLHVWSGGKGHYVIATDWRPRREGDAVDVFEPYAKDLACYASDDCVSWRGLGARSNATVLARRLLAGTREDFAYVCRANGSEDDSEVGWALLVGAMGQGVV